MEILKNCNIIIDIELIENITGSNQYFEVVFSNQNKEKYKMVFDFVWDMRYSIENGYIDRISKFVQGWKQESGVFLIENSKYIEYFESQVSGTLPTDNIKDYLIVDKTDTILEILTNKEPVLFKIDS